MLTSESANRMVEAAVAKAAELGIPGSVTVVDAGGHMKAFQRMDGAVLGSADGAGRKAHTAVVTGMSTSQWFQIVTGDPSFGAILGHGMDGVLFLPGGEPIPGADGPIGAVGFSGGQPDQDTEVVEAALAAG